MLVKYSQRHHGLPYLCTREYNKAVCLDAWMNSIFIVKSAHLNSRLTYQLGLFFDEHKWTEGEHVWITFSPMTKISQAKKL
jgi:hypothetical protein